MVNFKVSEIYDLLIMRTRADIVRTLLRRLKAEEAASDPSSSSPTHREAADSTEDDTTLNHQSESGIHTGPAYKPRKLEFAVDEAVRRSRSQFEDNKTADA